MAAPVLDLKIRKDFLIAVLERKTVVYKTETLKLFETFDSFDNAKGLCAVSQDLRKIVLAMPSHNDGKPWVQVYFYSERPGLDSHASKWIRKQVQTNHEKVGALALNHNGTLLASGSHSGTNVKIFSTYDGT